MKADDFLEHEDFLNIVRHTPLISIDLLVFNQENKILLGERTNKPAQDYWFVPGGRIRKNETLDAAFKRVTLDEFGRSIDLNTASPRGVYEHFYSDCFAGSETSTHYIVLAYKLDSAIIIDDLPHQQHQRYQWFTVEELLSSQRVHQYTKNYFNLHVASE